MKFLLDACAASRTLREALSALGHDVRSAAGELARASDEVLLALAYEEGRVLVTEDKDFGEVISCGVFRIRASSGSLSYGSRSTWMLCGA